MLSQPVGRDHVVLRDVKVFLLQDQVHGQVADKTTR